MRSIRPRTVLIVAAGAAAPLAAAAPPISGDRAVAAAVSSPLWPMRATAAAAQAELDAGHQPWRCDPAATVRTYATTVLGWATPAPRRLAADVYQIGDRATGATAVVAVTRPFTARTCALDVVSDVAR